MFGDVGFRDCEGSQKYLAGLRLEWLQGGSMSSPAGFLSHESLLKSVWALRLDFAQVHTQVGNLITLADISGSASGNPEAH